MASIKDAHLVVEGKNDRHVIWALCEQHSVEETFTIEVPDIEDGGKAKLIEGIPVRLKAPGLKALGIVLDADENIESAWQAVKGKLRDAGYESLPDEPSPEGTIIAIVGKPKVGVWIMPDNQLPGILENFIATLIPDGDNLAPKAEAILQEIEGESLNRYSSVKHPKAFIHTWLAWQENPGQPMGLAITAHSLNHNAPLANTFVAWLRNLFTSS